MRTVRIIAVVVLASATCGAQSVTNGTTAALLSTPPGDNAGGGSVAGGNVTAQLSVGDGFPGVVTTGGTHQITGNFTGQLYDVSSFAVSADPATVNERETRQLTAEATLDDATRLTVSPGDVLWNETSPAIDSISAAGLVTAGTVFEDTVANLTGSYQSISDADGFDLTVRNTTSDDFGAYAADGIDDDWQVGYFGLPPNPLAAPTANDDHDRDNNLTEFLAGFDPTDPDSFLDFKMMDVGGTIATFQLNKAIPNRTYRLMENPDLQGSFTEVLTFTVPNEETDKTVQDPGAPVGANFYQLQIERP